MPDDRNYGEDEFPAETDTSGLASVVLVERREDVAAVCGRVDTAPTYAVVIHAPQGNRQLSTELGMRRLRRHAEESGRVVAIATTNVNLAARARQAGIPVARRPEHVRWESGGHRVVRLLGRNLVFPAVGRYLQLAVIFFVAVIFVAALLAVAPSGHVDAFPPTETLSSTVVVKASVSRSEADLATLEVPAREVSASRTLTFAVPATGTTTVVTGPAEVTLTVTNTGAATVTVPAGSVVTGAGGVAFVTVTEAVIISNATATVMATAADGGSAAAVAPGTLTSWREPALEVLSVTNAGASAVPTKQVPAAHVNDITALHSVARSAEASEAVKRIIIEARPHDAIFLETATVVVQEEEPSAAVGSPADIVFMDTRVTVTAYAIPQETLEQVARHVLGRDAQGEFIPGSVTAIENGARTVSPEEGTFTTSFALQGEFARGVSVAAVKGAVKGRSTSAAESTLATRYGIQNAHVKVTPGWAPWLPRFAFRIDVDLRSEKAETAGQGAPVDAATPAPAD